MSISAITKPKMFHVFNENFLPFNEYIILLQINEWMSQNEHNKDSFCNESCWLHQMDLLFNGFESKAKFDFVNFRSFAVVHHIDPFLNETSETSWCFFIRSIFSCIDKNLNYSIDGRDFMRHFEAGFFISKLEDYLSYIFWFYAFISMSARYT